MEEKPLIAITMGDPCGIGPEVVAKALTGRSPSPEERFLSAVFKRPVRVKGLATSEVYELCRPLVIGSAWAMEQAVRLVGATARVQGVESPEEAGLSPDFIDVLDPHNLGPEEVTPGRISPAAGRASMEWVSLAAELAMAGRVRAIATAPINKEAAAQGGYKELGHTELLQRLTGAPQVATMLMAGPLRVVHLTTHRSLRQACDYVKKATILARLELIRDCFRKWGMGDPRIAVAALNPHASDGGLLGREEQEEIEPAVQEARRRGIKAWGPVPADIVFHQAIQGQYDVVLAMYHDQGHIPIKVYRFEDSVSVNLGLPFIRTSVDHGTAFDIAGKGVASPVSMREAIKVAAALATGKGLP
jgi:4-hydroxythreonine-4-phosphate dehydrogenase